MHPDQLTVSPAIVRRLVDEQFPAWRTMPVVPVDREGTVNAIYRIGDRIAARFPLRAEEPDVVRRQLQTEASAARELSGRTRFPTPEPVALGEPGVGDLRAHDAWMEECFDRSTGLLDVPVLRRHWSALRDLPRSEPDVMTHGDLIPGNVLVGDGRLVGV